MEREKTNCPFCEIVSSSHERILKESEHSVVIFSNPRLMKGHLLVVPKRHIEKLAELKKEELDDLMQLVIAYEEKILERFSKGCDIRQNYRPFMQQSDLKVNHLHFHLQPRELCDELYEKCQKYEKEIFHKMPEIEKEIKEIFSH